MQAIIAVSNRPILVSQIQSRQLQLPPYQNIQALVTAGSWRVLYGRPAVAVNTINGLLVSDRTASVRIGGETDPMFL